MWAIEFCGNVVEARRLHRSYRKDNESLQDSAKVHGQHPQKVSYSIYVFRIMYCVKYTTYHGSYARACASVLRTIPSRNPHRCMDNIFNIPIVYSITVNESVFNKIGSFSHGCV